MALKTLTKSRFKLAIECPAKVFYSLDNRYADQRRDDDFLEALANGGHQVGELAKLMYRARDPQAVEVDARDQEEQVRQTAALLQRDQVTIFEPTILHENLLVRVDVLVKDGTHVDLIEVKAKSWNPAEDSLIGRTPRANPIAPDWESYVYDVAFQEYVLSKAYPAFQVRPSLLLLDKSRRNSIPGFGAKFPVVGDGRDTRVEPEQGLDVTALAEPLLVRVDATEAVRRAHELVRKRRGRTDLEFEPLVQQVAAAIERNERISTPPSNACKKCEFYCDPELRTDTARSGWAECMEAWFHGEAVKPRSESIFGFYGQAKVTPHIESRRLWMADLAIEDLEVREKGGQISGTERHAFQWREVVEEDREPYLQQDELRAAMSAWKYPLHFIDFETAAPALPFHVGHRPYQQILFQFSHHVVERDGSVRHATECLIHGGNGSPSIDVVRRLREAIGSDEGTVLHWYPHERTILAAIRAEISEQSPVDANELTAFLDSLGLERDANRRMFDLGRLMSNQVFLPGTGGSSSMKKFLPAVIRQSAAVRQQYSRPVYGTTEVPSLNFSAQQWVVEKDGECLDPYHLLAPVFGEASINEALAALEDMEGDVVANGAAAMIAYAKLQDPGLSSAERDRLDKQLRRYCELDTLAMVMVYQALHSWVGERAELA